MAFMAALEADLRGLSAGGARPQPPRTPPSTQHSSVKSVKLSVIGLSCLQKLISHDAVASSALKEILATLRDHSEMPDESLQLKTLQTMLIVFQSHLRPESEEDMSQALGICLHLLESSRSSDSVRNTAAATFRQAVALVFDNVVLAESLPTGKASPARLGSSASSVANNVTRSFGQTLSLAFSYGELTMREDLTDVGKLGLRLLEDLTALAAGGSARWLHAQSLHRTFALDILEFVLSTYVPVFRALLSYQQVLRHQICSLLMTSLRTNVELEGEAGEPAFRRLVLRLVAHVIRLYSSSLVTESEVFLNMLVKVTRLDLPLWHQILVLEILRGFCVEARTLRSLFQTFDINPTNTNVVENIVKALALVVATIQSQTGMVKILNSKAAEVQGLANASPVDLALSTVGILASCPMEASDHPVHPLEDGFVDCDGDEEVVGDSTKNVPRTCLTRGNRSQRDSMTARHVGILPLIFSASERRAAVGTLPSETGKPRYCTGKEDIGQARSLLIVSTCSSVQPIGAAEHNDRLLCSSTWSAEYPHCLLRCLSSAAFDHCPLLLYCAAPTPGDRQFHFERFWPKLEGFHLVVSEAWNFVEHDSDLFRQTQSLLPKRADAESLFDYRSISLIHLIAKLFAKALSLRLAPCLGGMVSVNRSVFIAGRRIHDNLLLVQQTVRLIHNLKVPRMMLKLDVARAFDSVSWPFLLQILSHLGFGPRWCVNLVCVVYITYYQISRASDSSEETLAAVAGMFSSKAKGIEWSMDTDASNAAVLVASEAHTITLALEGLLGVVFTIATLTDEALDAGEACGVLRAIEPLNSFLASLCKFTINNPNEGEKRSSILLSPGSKKPETSMDQRDSIILTPKNVQALRTLFNVAHRLHNILGPSWVLEVSASVSRLSRDTSGQYSDFHILSSLNSQLFESSALMNVAAVKSLLSALHQLSSQHISGNSQLSGQQIGSIAFSVERMTSILVNNLHRVESIWDQIAAHHLEVAVHIFVLTVSFIIVICNAMMILMMGISSAPHPLKEYQLVEESETRSFEYAVLSPLVILYSSNKNIDVQMGALKILLHVLEFLTSIFSRAVADASEKDVISLGFQSVRVIMNEGLATIPVQCLDECILVTGAYGAQKTDINISLTAAGLLWTATDFIVKGLSGRSVQKANHLNEEVQLGVSTEEGDIPTSEEGVKRNPLQQLVDYNKLFFSVFSVLQKLGADDRPEVRNSAVRTLFQTLCTHGQKLSLSMWEDCLWIYVFPMLEHVSHLASTSSKDEWHGKELGTRAGKAVHMLIHHSRNTAQKQWDETIVLLLGGIARLLRSFFPLLQQLSKFSSGWAILLAFLKNSILNGSKEGNLESSFVKSVLDIYELVLQTSPNYKSDSADKVKQEVLRGLGDLYVQAQSLFNDDMYLRLMAVMHLMIKSSMNSSDYDSELGSIPAVQRGILEIIPMLRPTTMLSSMWSPLLLELLCYLNGEESPLHRNSKEIREQNSDALANGTKRSSVEQGHINGTGTKGDTVVGCGWGILFIEKLVPIMVNLFLEAPPNERCSASPQVIQGLGSYKDTMQK
uniref:Protein MON2-like protein n=1 Tax=Aegilops tauschii TaxID=37682 RepID=M8CGH6_AEGTA